MSGRGGALMLALVVLVGCAPRSPLAEIQPAFEPAAAIEVAAPDDEREPGPGITIGEDLLGSATYDLPLVANGWVRLELEFLVHQRGEVVRRWMERERRYAPMVRSTLAEHGLPSDLIHLAMIESGFQPTVRSRAGAVGIWQFMPATARGVGLRVDSLVDERMDPVRSTHAAARHLRALHRRFGGDWELAAAAYNAGEGRIGRALARFGARDFWELTHIGDLAQETRHYVPRLFAMTIIGRDPGRFGLAPDGEAARELHFDSVRVGLETPLPLLGGLGGVAADELRELNPHLIRQVAPRGYVVWVPAGTAAAVSGALEASEFRRRGGFVEHAVRAGESLDAIALRAAMCVDELRLLNVGIELEPLRPGSRIRVYADAPSSGGPASLPSAGASVTVRTSSSASPTTAPSSNCTM